MPVYRIRKPVTLVDVYYVEAVSPEHALSGLINGGLPYRHKGTEHDEEAAYDIGAYELSVDKVTSVTELAAALSLPTYHS